MSLHILLGGNGYIGREVTRQWLAADPNARFIVVSRSGNNALQSDRVTNLAADASNYDELSAKLPAEFDSISNFLGRPATSDADNEQTNIAPVRAMLKLAQSRHAKAVGFIGGRLGDKQFTQTKAALIQEIKASGIPFAYVEPTLVYGGGRNDKLSRLVPLLKFFGLFSDKFKPVKVEKVAASLVAQLRKLTA